MKFLLLAALIAVCAAAPQYGQQQTTLKKVTTFESRTSQQGGQLRGQLSLDGQQQQQQAEARQLKHPQLKQDQSKDAAAETLQEEFAMADPNHYSYLLKTSNGIEKQEQAEVDGESSKVQGEYSWVAPDGRAFKVQYIADDSGFHPVGDHLPQEPELPVAIARALEWNAQHPEEEAEEEALLKRAKPAF